MPEWLDVAAGYIGLEEIPGPQHEPIIVNWGKKAGVPWWNNDEDPWCAIFVNGVMVECGIRSSKSALAQKFREWGTRLKRAVPGAVFVMPRGRRGSIYGHTGIVEKVHRNGTVTVIDGNKNNRVQRTVYKASTFFKDGLRWPPGAPMTPEAQAAVAGVAPEPEYALGDRELLVKGMSGPDVEEAQVILDALGLMDNNEELAFFGDETFKAVWEFQKLKGLDRDGKIGTATAPALLEAMREHKAKAAARKRARETTAPAVSLPTAGGIGGVGIGAVLAWADQVKALNDGTVFGLMIAVAVILALIGGAVYFYMSRRSEAAQLEAVE